METGLIRGVESEIEADGNPTMCKEIHLRLYMWQKLVDGLQNLFFFSSTVNITDF